MTGDIDVLGEYHIQAGFDGLVFGEILLFYVCRDLVKVLIVCDMN